MVDLDTVPHHPAIEEITSIICNRTQNQDRPFFRTIVSYFLMMTAATMRARMNTLDRGEIPVNGYAIALSPSGTGKGFSVKILEDEIFKDFRRTFVDYTLPHLASVSINKLAMRRAARNGTDEALEVEKLEKEYEGTGAYIFAFDDGSSPAIRQVRQKLLIASAGSINFQVDECGSNLPKISEALAFFLELYDQGAAKQKLLKNTADSKRLEEIEGKTPANLLLFGTPAKLFDGGPTEDQFYGLLETGYARRCLFAMGHPVPSSNDATPDEIFDLLCDPGLESQGQAWANHFAALADVSKFNWLIDVPKDVGVALLEYRIQCEDNARLLADSDEIRKAELSHRYFKALKLAGALAFIEEAMTMTKDHLYAAIKLVEESGKGFQSILKRERTYMKLARYIATVGSEVTHSDLLEALPFYKSGPTARNEMMTMAVAWGYKSGNIVIKKQYVDGIEFFSGETLKETDLGSVSLSYSEDWAYDYQAAEAPFDQLHQLVLADDLNWSNHCFEKGHRSEETAIPGFNLLVLDVDGGASLQTVHELMEDYVFMTHTTKRHTPDSNRFRLILPLNYELKLDAKDYREFFQNIIQWLPFGVDESAKDRSRKWLTNPNGVHHYNLGENKKLLDVLPFIPKTSKNEQHRKQLQELSSLDGLERWFAQHFGDGNRNNLMIRYALALVSWGMSYNDIENSVISFNKKMNNGLSEDELRRTVLVTVAKRLQANTAAA